MVFNEVLLMSCAGSAVAFVLNNLQAGRCSIQELLLVSLYRKSSKQILRLVFRSYVLFSTISNPEEKPRSWM